MFIQRLQTQPLALIALCLEQGPDLGSSVSLLLRSFPRSDWFSALLLLLFPAETLQC